MPPLPGISKLIKFYFVTFPIFVHSFLNIKQKKECYKGNGCKQK